MRAPLILVVLVIVACGNADPGMPVEVFRDHSYVIVSYQTRCTFDVAGLDYYVSGDGAPATSPGWDPNTNAYWDEAVRPEGGTRFSQTAKTWSGDPGFHGQAVYLAPDGERAEWVRCE